MDQFSNLFLFNINKLMLFRVEVTNKVVRLCERQEISYLWRNYSFTHLLMRFTANLCLRIVREKGKRC